MAEADEAVAAALAYGHRRGSTLWYDLEAFDINQPACRDSALALVSAWTDRLHAARLHERLLLQRRVGHQDARRRPRGHRRRLRCPTRSGSPTTSAAPSRATWGTTRTEYISDDGWPGNRMRQFCGTHTETYGGVSITIDSNFMDFGRGSEPTGRGRALPRRRRLPALPPPPRRPRRQGQGTAVLPAQGEGLPRGLVHGRFHAGTAKAVKRFQRHEPTLRVGGKADRKTWTALLAQGSDPLLKYGSRTNAVRRLRSALNAAEGDRLEVTGVFERSTQRAVKSYQRGRGLPAPGVVTTLTWDPLQEGRR